MTRPGRVTLRSRSVLGRPAVITTAPGPLVRLLTRVGAWLDAHAAARDIAPLALPPARVDSRTLRPCPGVRRAR